jgi:hypothetical protein
LDELHVQVTKLPVEVQQLFASTSEIGVEAKIGWLLKKRLDAFVGVDDVFSAKKGGNEFRGAAFLLLNGEVAPLIKGEVNDVSLEVDTTVVMTNDGAVGISHALRSNELLWWEEVDRALRHEKATDLNVYRVAVDVDKFPVDQTVSGNG